jgi:ribosomal protein L37AE/L43A
MQKKRGNQMFENLFTGGIGRHKAKGDEAGEHLKLIKRHSCPFCEREVAESIPRCPNCGNSVQTAWLDTAVSLSH